MNLDALIASKIVADLGWTLFNSVWQIGLLTGILFAVLRVLHTRSANLRYVVSVVVLAICVIMPVVTYIQVSGSGPAEYRAGTASGTRDRGTAANYLLSAYRPAGAAIGDQTPAEARTGTVGYLSGLRDYFDTNSPNILPLSVGLWLLGVAFFSVRLGGGIWQLRRYKTSNIEPPDAEWQARFSVLCERLRVMRPVRFLSSTLVETPVAIGIFKPLILVPASAFFQISPSQMETVIAHELIHIRRFDPLINILQNAVEVMFFYHPGIWWISAQARREREFAADAAVLEVFHDSHVMYARALANLEEIRLRTNQTPRVATAANGGNLMQRIQKILKIKTEVSNANFAWSAGLALLLTSAVLTLVFSFSSPGLVNAQGKAKGRKMAVGFVAIPPVDRSEDPPKESDATARLMIAKLQQYKIPAIGFVNGSSISDGSKLYPVRANIVRLWRDAGLEVGVGGYDHIWFSKTDYTDYVANAAKNVTVVGPVLAEKNLPVRYYSYPYLNTGKTDGDHQLFERWLADHNLRSVKYTVDNSEWMYSYAYDLARNDNDVGTMKEIRTAFLEHMTQMLELYEAYSAKMFGRDIAQTMVLTPSRLVTDSADELFGMIQQRGYTFVPMDEAQADEAYKTEEHFAGDSGISWFERWAMHKGMPLLDEPKVHSEIQKMWKEKKPSAGNKKKDS